MSITSLFGPTGPKEIRSEMSKRFIKPRVKLKDYMVAPPLTKNYPGVGAAFDYLLRFYLERKHRNRLVYRNRWVADHSVELISSLAEHTVDTKTIFNGKYYSYPELEQILKKKLEQIKSHLSNYIETGLMPVNLIESSLFLGQLDLIVRAPSYSNNFFGIYNKDDVLDLINLFKSIDDSSFKMRYQCYLNPTFGDGSSLVGGADADIIIDDLLIDIKVTKNQNLKRDYFNQLIGYYVLSSIGGINDKPQKKPIKRLGIYFARHSRLLSFSINQISDEKGLNDFKNWLISFLKSKDNNYSTF